MKIKPEICHILKTITKGLSLLGDSDHKQLDEKGLTIKSTNYHSMVTINKKNIH